MKKKRFAAAVASLAMTASVMAVVPINASAENYTVLTGVTNTGITVDDNGTSAALTFASSDGTINENADLLEYKTIDWVTPDEETDEKVDLKTLKIDISGVTFTEPGVYRYKIKESGIIAGVTNDTGVTTDTTTGTTNSVRYLDVYITDTEGTLTFDSYVLHSAVTAPDRNTKTDEGYKESASALTDKSTGFTNQYATQNLESGKEVTGNQGSKDKRFAVQVKTTNANADTVYQLDGNWTKEPAVNNATNSEYTANIMKTANNVTSLTGAQLNNGYTFYLSDGEYVKVKGLEVTDTAVAYTISETAEDYDSIEKIVESVAKYGNSAHTDDVSGTITSGNDIYTGFTNNRSGAIPTGILSTAASSAGIAALGIIGITGGAVYLKKKKSEEE